MKTKIVALAAQILLCTGSAFATSILPTTTDSIVAAATTYRYDPANFNNGGTWKGFDNNIVIGFGADQGYGSRPVGFNTTFYDTQGKQFAANGGVGDGIALFVYLAPSMASELNGSRQWQVGLALNNQSGTSPLETFFGFTNTNGAGTGVGHLWYSVGSTVVNLANTVTYGWNKFDIVLADNINFFFNQELVSSASSNNLTKIDMGMIAVKNFTGNDPGNGTVVAGIRGDGQFNMLPAPQVPEPSTYLMILSALSLLVWKRKLFQI